MKKTIMILLCLLLAGRTVCATTYDLVYPYQDDIARVVTDLKWGLLDVEENEVFSPYWDYIGILNDDRRLVMKNSLFGFMDAQNNAIIMPQYTVAENFAEGLACVRNAEGKWGFIDSYGNTVIPFEYDDANSFSDSLALVKKDGLFGYINKENAIVIPFAFQEAYPFSEERACVLWEGAYGYLDTTGTMMIQPKFALAFDFSEGGAVVKTSSGYGLIDSFGGYILEPRWEQLSPQITNSFLKASKNGKLALVDTNGCERTDYIYDDIGDYSEDLWPACLQGKYGYINADGNTIIAHNWDSAGSFSEGLAPVSQDGLYGYIDTAGNPVTEFIYTDAGRMSSGWAPVQNADGQWQFIQPILSSAFSEADLENALVLQIGRPTLRKANQEIPLEAAPVLKEDSTLLPIRAVIESLGGTVEWNAAKQKITVRHKDRTVILYLNENGAYVNGRLTFLDVAPEIQNDSTMVPLRFVMESFDYAVDWEPKTREILIQY